MLKEKKERIVCVFIVVLIAVTTFVVMGTCLDGFVENLRLDCSL
jgi:hypothetical protein